MAEEIQDNGTDFSKVRLGESKSNVQTHVREAAFNRAVEKITGRTTLDATEVVKQLQSAFTGFKDEGTEAASAFAYFDKAIVDGIGGQEVFEQLIEEATSEAENEYREKMKSIANTKKRRVKVRRDVADYKPGAAYRLGYDKGKIEGKSDGKRIGYENGFNEGIKQGIVVEKMERVRQSNRAMLSFVNTDTVRSQNRNWFITQFAFDFSIDTDMVSRTHTARGVIHKKINRAENSLEVFCRSPHEDRTQPDQVYTMEHLLTGLVIHAQPYCDIITFIEAMIASGFVLEVATTCGVSNSDDINSMRGVMYRAARINTDLV